MESLKVTVVQLDLKECLVTAVRDELLNQGMSTGTVLIGSVGLQPPLIYFLWFRADELPVSMILRDPLENVASARCAARQLILKWLHYRSDVDFTGNPFGIVPASN